LCTKIEYPRIICGKSELSAKKVKTFHEKSQNFLKKEKLSADFTVTVERCGKARHSMNYSASRQAFLKSGESFDFPQIIL
jgi:hypothetical protein